MQKYAIMIKYVKKKKKLKENLKNDAIYAMLTHPQGHWMIRVIYRLTPEIIPASQPT